MHRLAGAGLKARTLPIAGGAPSPNMLSLFREGAVALKDCADGARWFEEDVVIPRLDQLEFSGAGLSKIRIRDVEDGPTGKIEAARHWFAGISGPTINLVSRRDADGPAGVHLLISVIVLAENSNGSFALDYLRRSCGLARTELFRIGDAGHEAQQNADRAKEDKA